MLQTNGSRSRGSACTSNITQRLHVAICYILSKGPEGFPCNYFRPQVYTIWLDEAFGSSTSSTSGSGGGASWPLSTSRPSLGFRAKSAGRQFPLGIDKGLDASSHWAYGLLSWPVQKPDESFPGGQLRNVFLPTFLRSQVVTRLRTHNYRRQGVGSMEGDTKSLTGGALLFSCGFPTFPHSTFVLLPQC